MKGLEMNNIDDIFEEYKGHVFSFEYDPNQHIRLMKCFFKPDWDIQKEGIIVKRKDNLTYLITKNPEISFTDMLTYVSEIIKVNIEREEKIKLLLNKKRELEELFNNKSLDELSKLDFIFKQNEIINNIVSDDVTN